MTDEMPVGDEQTAQEPTMTEAAEKQPVRKRTPLLVVGALAVVLVAGAIGWYMYTRSPQYALKQLSAAAEKGDWERLNEHLVVSAVASDAVSAALDKTFEGAGDGKLATALMKKYTASNEPSLTASFADTLRQDMAKEPATSKPTIFMAPRLAAKPVSLEVEGDSALAVVGSEEASATNLQLAMARNDDGVWQVTSWANADKTLETGGGAWWVSYTETPQYSLARMTVAVSQGDWEQFRQYVDVDNLSQTFVDAAVDTAISEFMKEEADNPFAAWGVAILQGMKSSIVKEVKDAFKKVVTSKGEDEGAESMSASFIIDIPVKVSASGNDAKLTYKSYDEQGKRVDVVIRVERDGKVWRIVEFDNANDLLGELDLK